MKRRTVVLIRYRINKLILRRNNVLLFVVSSTLLFSLMSTFEIFTGHCHDNSDCQLETEENYKVQISPAPEGYVVFTPSCKIWDADPFDKNANRFFRNKTKPYCSEKPLIVLRPDDKNLTYNPENVLAQSAKCCFREVHRVSQSTLNYNNSADWIFRKSPGCKKIPKDDRGVRISKDFIETTCIVRFRGTSAVVYDYIASVPHPHDNSPRTKNVSHYWETVEADALLESVINSLDDDPQEVSKQANVYYPPNVIIIGLDTVSRLHAVRSLPETQKLLQDHHFVELKGHTKIGENTFPNMMGALAGMPLDDYPCLFNASSKLDDCPFIWKEFSQRHYVTGFAEDWPEAAIFNYLKVGFVEQPVDYYFRPLSVAYKSNNRRTFNGCISGMPEPDFIIKYTRDFVLEMEGKVPYFMLTWMTRVSHDDFNGLKTYDSDIRELLEDILKVGADNTIVIFMSDHGPRYGKFRQTFIGYYEENLPFLYIRIPKSLLSAYPHWYKNLKQNAHRLTSHLDLHQTLRQIIRTVDDQMTPGEDRPDWDYSQEIYEAETENRYYSLFEEIPGNRTCANSGIPQLYCRCGVNPLTTQTSNLSIEFAQIIITNVNKLLETRRHLCVPLKHKKFLYLREIGEDQITIGSSVAKYTDHLVALEASPSGAYLEAQVRKFSHNNTLTLVGDVSRTNSYKGQNDCLDDYKLKSFCICRDYFKKLQDSSKYMPG